MKFIQAIIDYFHSKLSSLAKVFSSAVSDSFTALGKGLTDSYEKLAGYFQAKAQKAFLSILHLIGKEYLSAATNFIEKAEKAGGVPDEVKPFFDMLKEQKGEAAAMMAMGVGNTALSAGTGTIINALFRVPTQKLNAAMPHEIPDISTVLAGWRRGIIDEETASDLMRRMAFNEEKQGWYKKLTDNLFPVDLLRIETYRMGMSEAEVKKQLHMQGYTAEQIKAIFTAWKPVPGISDMLEMFTKNITDENLAKKYQLDADKPPHFYEWFWMNGVSKEWADAYWREYWNYPSPGMLYEMRHRGLIGDEDVTNTLLILNYPKYWREKLLALSYNPYTRVDVRRMYRTGVIGREEVKKTYLDLGYDEKHAENLTKYTIINASEKEKELSRSDVLKGYEEEIVSRDEAVKFLLEVGYSKESAEFIISETDWKLAHQAKTEMKGALRSLYEKGIRDEAYIRKELKEAGYHDSTITNFLKVWSIKREENTKKSTIATERDLTKSDILDAFKKRLLTEAETTEYLKSLGYDDSETKLLIARTEYVKEKSKKELSLSGIKKMYLAGIITENDAIDRLAKMNLGDAEAHDYLSLWNIEKEPKTKLPSLAELHEFLKKGVIDEAIFREEANNLGYEKKYIDWFVKAWGGGKA